MLTVTTSTREFLSIEAGVERGHHQMKIGDHLVGGMGGIFGGCAVAASAVCMERMASKPIRWLTVQFSGSTGSGDLIDLHCEQHSSGRHLSQMEVRASVEGRRAWTALGVVGERPADEPTLFLTAPTVPEPVTLAPYDFRQTTGLVSELDCRPVPSPNATTDGVAVFWVRHPGVTDSTLVMGSIAADIIPLALSAAMGEPVFGSSLDNTFRVVDLTSTSWILVRSRVESLAGGMGNVTFELWSEERHLVAIASQTCAVIDVS